MITVGLRTWRLVAASGAELDRRRAAEVGPTSLTIVPPAITPAFGITLVMKPAAGMIEALAIWTGAPSRCRAR